MKMMKVFLFSVLAIALLYSTANAQMMGQSKGMMCDKMGMMGSGMRGMMHGMGKDMGMMGDRDMMHSHFMKKGLHFYFKNKEALGLTDDQLEKLHDIKIDFKKRYIMDKAKLKVAKLELEELLDSDSVNMKSVEKKVKEIAGLKEKLLLAKVKTRVDAKKILTKEQRKKAKRLRHHKKEVCQMMKGGRGMMGGMGGQGMMYDDMNMEKMKLEKKESSHEEHY